MFNIDKLFNKILNRINLNYLSFFFLLSLIDLLIYGINNHDYQLYNLDPLFRSRIIDGILNFNNYFITNNLSLQYYYIKYLTPILEYGIIFIIASIIIKFFIYVIVYKLAFHQTRDKSHSILISVLLIGAASLLTNGSVLNGIWGSPIIMPASLSTVFSLLSLYYFLKNKYVIASILISISIHFHSLYAMTFYAWLFIGLVMIEYKINNFKYIKNFIFGSVIIIINIVYISIISGYSDANFVGSNISLNQWYEKIRTINPDDVFLLYNIRLFGATLLPPILLGSYLSIKSKNKSPYDFLMIGIFLSLILFCFIEFLHLNGIFFGKISEYFISSQLRRGIWVGKFLSLFVIINNRELIYCSTIKNNSLRFYFLFLLILLYMIPNELVTSVFFALLFFIFYKKTKNNAFIFLSIFPLILLSFSILFDWGIVLPSFNYFIYIFSGTLIFIFFNWIIKLDNYKIVFISISTALLMQLLFFGILNGRFINSFKTLFNEGFTAKTNYYLLAKQKYSSLDIEISKYLNNKELNNKKGYFLLIPPTLGSYSDPSFYGMSLFFSHNNMISTVWNRNQYQITFDKLVNLYGEDIVNNYYNTFLETKSTWQNYFIYYYNNIDLNKLKKLYNNYNIRYFILDNDFAEIKNILVYKSDKNSLYDLSLIQ